MEHLIKKKKRNVVKYVKIHPEIRRAATVVNTPQDNQNPNKTEDLIFRYPKDTFLTHYDPLESL